MDKYESKSKKITYKSYEDFIEQFNQLEIAWDMPIAIRDDEVDWTTTYLKAKRVYYYVRI